MKAKSEAFGPVWLLKEGEPLPLAQDAQKLRMARLAEALSKKGLGVVWFTGAFDHGRKQKVRLSQTILSALPYTLCPLISIGYSRNVSPRRILHQMIGALHFLYLTLFYPRPSIIVAAYPTPELAFAGALASKLLRVPFVIDIRDPWPEIFEGGGGIRSWFVSILASYYRMLLRYAVRTAQSRVAISEKLLQWALALSKVSKGKDDHAMPIGYQNHLQEALHKDPSPLHVVFYGVIGKTHSLVSLIEAARTLSMQKNDQVKFTIIGDGDSLRELRELAHGLKNITFTGWLDRISAHEVLRSAHVGLILVHGAQSQFWYGNKLFEYLSFGLPVISNALSDLQDLIAQYDIGASIPSDDPSLLIQAMSTYLDNPATYTRQRNNAQKLFADRFSSDHTDEIYSQLVLKLIRSSDDL